MAFCPYCGKQTADGEICSCTTVNTTQTDSGASVNYSSFSGSTPPPPPRPAVPTAPERPAGPPRGENAPLPNAPAAPAGAAPQSGFAPQSSFAPQSDFAPQSNQTAQAGYASQSGYAPQSGFAPQSSYGIKNEFNDFDEFADVPSAANTYAPPPPPPAPKQSSAFVDALKDLLGRAAKLVSPKADESIEDALKATDISWSVVFGAYALLGSLACGFVIPKFISNQMGAFARFGDVLGDMFGGILWRALLVNILTVALCIAAVACVCAITKKKLSINRTLNLVGLAFVPAAVFNALGLLFSFFFPAGTVVCGVISAVCTIFILCAGLDAHCGKRILWHNAITIGVIVLIYILMVYLMMDAVIADILSSLVGNIFG